MTHKLHEIWPACRFSALYYGPNAVLCNFVKNLFPLFSCQVVFACKLYLTLFVRITKWAHGAIVITIMGEAKNCNYGSPSSDHSIQRPLANSVDCPNYVYDHILVHS